MAIKLSDPSDSHAVRAHANGGVLRARLARCLSALQVVKEKLARIAELPYEAADTREVLIIEALDAINAAQADRVP